MHMKTSLDLCWVWREIGINFYYFDKLWWMCVLCSWICHYMVLGHVSATLIQSICDIEVDAYSGQQSDFANTRLLTIVVTHMMGVLLTWYNDWEGLRASSIAFGGARLCNFIMQKCRYRPLLNHPPELLIKWRSGSVLVGKPWAPQRKTCTAGENKKRIPTRCFR